MNIRKHYRIEIGELRSATVILAGCGGTGSFAALHLARLAWAAKQRGVQIGLVFVDPDTVEEKNVGRQNFVPAEIGLSKALALATRYSLGFGLRIAAVKGEFGSAGPISHFRAGYNQHLLVVGAVDSPVARRQIHEAMLAENGHGGSALTWWLDAGNNEHSGQVCLGNSAHPRPVLSPLGVCTGLPLPSLQEPGLIAPAPQRPPGERELSCAELLALDAQSLMINQAMAGWLGVYAYRLLLGRDLDLMATYVDLAAGSARSVAITEGVLERTEELIAPPTARQDDEDGEAQTCPQCGHDGLLEGVDEIDPEIGEEDIIYCPMCDWRMYLEDWYALTEETETMIEMAETE